MFVPHENEHVDKSMMMNQIMRYADDGNYVTSAHIPQGRVLQNDRKYPGRHCFRYYTQILKKGTFTFTGQPLL